MPDDQFTQAFSALHAPIAQYTWEVRADLEDDQAETARIPIRWNQPLEILGIYGSIVVTGAEELVTPTMDDILVQLDLNDRHRVTNRLESPAAAVVPEAAVTLSAICVNNGVRLLRLRLERGAPNAGIKFFWERGADVYQTTRVKLAFYCNYI